MERTFTVEEVFQLVATAVSPYFHERRVILVDDDQKTSTMPLTDFVVKCVAEEMAEKWADEEEINPVLEKNYPGVIESKPGLGLRSILGGSHRNKTIRMKKSEYLREHHHLFKVLRNPTRRALNAELRRQKRELRERGLKG
jgi:hypothetical protein